MTRKLMLGFTAMLIAMTTLATAPARAQDNDQFGRLLAGAVTLFIIGKAIEDANDKKKPDVSRSNVTTTHRFGDTNDRLRKNDHRKTHPHKILPDACAFTIRRGGEHVRVYGQRCLNEVMKKPEWLPRDCRMNVPVRYGQPATVYGARCLAEYGYRANDRQARRRN